LLVEIPTDARQPSMNLGQAVAVCLYELASGAKTRDNTAGLMYEPKSAPSLKPVAFLKVSPIDESPTGEISEPSARSGRLDLLAEVIEETMAAAHYSPASMQAANRHDLRLLLRRLAPTERDTRRILGLFRRILWRLHQNGKSR
jgi:tRNA/rRNA methyltransferase